MPRIDLDTLRTSAAAFIAAGYFLMLMVATIAPVGAAGVV